MSLTKKTFNYSFASFFHHNVNGGLLLMIVAVLAMLIANSPWSSFYLEFLDYPISLKFGDFNLLSHHGKPLTMAAFINDCLMAIFFFHVGLEIKREILVGELSSIKKASLPIIAAAGGMIIPVAIYFCFDHSEIGSRGAAIPIATDIAFSLGVLSLLGKRVPLVLKIFMTAFAVVDDIGGILVIALFYTSELEIDSLLFALALCAGLFTCNRIGIRIKSIYIVVGICVWYLFLQSGIHSTIAGVLVALTVPSQPQLKIGKYIERIRHSINTFPTSSEENIILSNTQIHELKNIEGASSNVISPLQYMEDKLHGIVNYIILPLFAFANAGIVLNSNNNELTGTVTYAIALALIFGKPIGIYTFTLLAVKFKLASLPENVNWKAIFGASCLGGIGFTVSLFIANLSFGPIDLTILNHAKVGIILGTIISGIVGYTILKKVLPKEQIN